MKRLGLLIGLICLAGGPLKAAPPKPTSAPKASATFPFDFGLPSFEELFRTFPKFGDSVVDISVAKETFGVSFQASTEQKPPQLYSSPVLVPSVWPSNLKREPLLATFTFMIGSDGIPKDIKRKTELHADLERPAHLYIGRLRYSPAEISGGAVPSSAEVVLRFEPMGD